MLPYTVYQDTKIRTADLNRRAEINRMIADARRDRRAARQLAARSRRRPGTVLQHLLPSVLTGSGWRLQAASAADSRRGSAGPRDELLHGLADRGGPDGLEHVEVVVCAGQLGVNDRVA